MPFLSTDACETPMSEQPCPTCDSDWLNDCPVPVLVLDERGCICFVSTALEQLSGISREALLGHRREDLASPMWRVLCSDEPVVGFVRPGSVETWLRRTPASMTRDGRQWQLHWFSDVSEEMRLRRENEALRAQVAQLNLHDGLTGLPNARAFEQALTAQVARSRRYHNPLSLLVIDVVVQEPGRPVSDDLVLAVSRYLRDRLRWVDTVARLEGPRFMALLPETREAEAWQLAGKLAATRASLELPAGTIDPGIDLRFAVTEWHKGDDPRVLRARVVSLLEVGKAA